MATDEETFTPEQCEIRCKENPRCGFFWHGNAGGSGRIAKRHRIAAVLGTVLLVNPSMSESLSITQTVRVQSHLRRGCPRTLSWNRAHMPR